MEPTEGCETSAALKLTPGKNSKEDIQHKVCDSFVWVRDLSPHSGQDKTEPDYLSVDFRRKLLGLGKWK
jgi:hypothetical protein